MPTLPPAMCAEIANPVRSAGNCSARSALPTGCCGDPATRDVTLAAAKPPKPGASAWAAKPPPKTTPPMLRIVLRETKRVSPEYVNWTKPDEMLPAATRSAMAAASMWNSGMIAR